MRFRRVQSTAGAVTAAILLAAAMLLSGCGSSLPGTREIRPPAGGPSLVWPAPPDAPRIAYIQSITRPADVGIKPSGARRVLRWITGTDRRREFLVKPFGIALDEHNNLCITDTGANAVIYYDRLARSWKRWERIGKLRFASPVAIAKRNGKFYVADSGLRSVIVFGEDGKWIRSMTGRFERPAGLAIANGHLLVADSSRHCIVTFTLDGEYVGEFGKRGGGAGEFNFPTHISAGAAGRLLITDSLNSRVQILSMTGAFQSEIGSLGDSPGHFGRPKGAAVDAEGHVYVVDALFDNVQVFDRDGRFLLTLGAAGSRPGEFWLANGIAISSDNEIFVADAYNHRVQVFKYVGER